MSTTQSDSPKGATPPISTNILNDKEGEYIAVVCGSIEGKLYFNKLKALVNVPPNWVLSSASLVLAIPGVAQLSLKVLVVKVKAKSGRSPSFIKVDSFNMSFPALGLKMIFLDRLNHPCAPNPLTHLKERCLLIQF